MFASFHKITFTENSTLVGEASNIRTGWNFLESPEMYRNELEQDGTSKNYH